MEIRELRSFCAAAKLRSISKAAEQLKVAQPTVTLHVKKLEAELGAVLFDRLRRPIDLTSTGLALMQLSIPLIDGIDSLKGATPAAERHVPVAVGATHDIISHALLRAVKEFIRMHPHVRISIRSGLISEVMSMVEDGDVDFGLTPAPERPVGFDFIGLFGSERVLITPKDHPLLIKKQIVIEDISEWPLILRRRETETSMVLESEFKRKGLDYEVLVELDSMEMVKGYVAQGLGISVGPRMAIEPEDSEQLGIVSLSNLLPVEQSGILTLHGKILPTSAKNFIAVIKDAFGMTVNL